MKGAEERRREGGDWGAENTMTACNGGEMKIENTQKTKNQSKKNIGACSEAL